jgi:site-specific recombinase XerD
MNELQVSLSRAGPGLESLVAQASLFMKAAKSPATRKAYDADLKDYGSFCTLNRLRFMPSTPEAVTLYVSSLASRVPPASVSTIQRRLAAISHLQYH